MNNRKLLVAISGPEQELFIQRLHDEGVNVYAIKRERHVVHCHIHYKQLKRLKKLRRSYRVKLSLTYVNQLFIQPELKLYLGLFCFILLPIIAQQYYWQVEIDAPTPELQKKVEQELHNLTFPLAKTETHAVQQIVTDILVNYPQIAWVHVRNVGSVLHFSVLPTPVKNEQQQQMVSAYIASKEGVIDRFELQSGQMVVKRGDTVQAGDQLVIDATNRGVKAKVFAQYFLHITFRIHRDYYFVVNDQKKQLQLNEHHIDTHILPLIERKILADRPAQTKLSLQKLLHVTFDNDKVIGEVLYLVNENIAIPSSNRARR